MDNNLTRARTTLMQEGLIKVPPLMMKQFHNAAAYFFLISLPDNIDGWREMPEHTRRMMKDEVARAMKRWKVYKPKHDFAVADKNDLVMMPVPFDRYKLPRDYKINYDGVIYLIMDFGHRYVSKGTNASWNAGKKAIGVNMNPEGVPQLRRATKQKDFRFQLDYIIKHYRNGLEHEMAHMIGELFVKQKDPKTQTWKGGYDDKDDEYFTSPIEFEPMIITTVRTFQQEIETLLHIFRDDDDPDYDPVRFFRRQFNVKEMAEIYAGLRKPKGLTGIQPHPFYKSLKKNAPAKWKTAYKKFFKELMPLLRKYK